MAARKCGLFKETTASALFLIMHWAIFLHCFCMGNSSGLFLIIHCGFLLMHCGLAGRVLSDLTHGRCLWSQQEVYNKFRLFAIVYQILIQSPRPSERAVVGRPSVLFGVTGNTSTTNLEISWLRYPIYILGSFHLFLSLWMVVEYFLINFPHLRMPEVFWNLMWVWLVICCKT